MKIGIFVGRFQTPELHNGYKYVLSNLQINFDEYCIIIGSSQTTNKSNPLDFETRKEMLEEYLYKKPYFISEIVDIHDNIKWCKKLEQIIMDNLSLHGIIYNIEDIYLVGSRDSFISTYNGIFQTIQLEPFGKFNSTELRIRIKFIINYNFILGYLSAFVKKNFKFLLPKTKYNSNWSKGYIYYVMKYI